MNKIVREHYPVAKLPEDLREGLDPDGTAVVTVRRRSVPQNGNHARLKSWSAIMQAILRAFAASKTFSNMCDASGMVGSCDRPDGAPLRVYIDTNVVIRGMERTDAGSGEVGHLIELAERGKLELVTSELTLSEVLVGPIKLGDDLLVKAYLDLLTRRSCCSSLSGQPRDAHRIFAYPARSIGEARRLPCMWRTPCFPAVASSSPMIVACASSRRSDVSRAFGPPLRRARHAEAMSEHEQPASRRASDLSVAFRQGESATLAVDHVSFSLDRGETLAIVGKSGSGKSVSALSIPRLLNYPAAYHPSGEIWFSGRDLLKASEAELREVRGNDITMVFQEPMTSLNPLHTVERQIGEILALHKGIEGSKARERTLALLEEVGIRNAKSRLGAFPHQLSGGQRQTRDDRHGARQ